MTDLEKGIFWKLTNSTSVTSLCPAAQIQVQEAKQDTPYPLIVFQSTTTYRNYTFSGPSGLTEDELQITCQGLTAASARSLAKAVFTLLDFADSKADSGWNGVTVQGVFHRETIESTFNIAGDGQETLIYEQDLKFKVMYNV